MGTKIDIEEARKVLKRFASRVDLQHRDRSSSLWPAVRLRLSQTLLQVKSGKRQIEIKRCIPVARTVSTTS